MSAHNTLTGADLHEPKGASTASANTVYVSDGAGSGTWKKPGADVLDNTSIKDVNRMFLTVILPAIDTASNILIPMTFNCTLNKITGVINKALGTADVTITAYKNGSSSMGTMAVAFTGSAKGDRDVISPSSFNTFVDGDFIEIASGGGGSGAVTMTFFLELTLT